MNGLDKDKRKYLTECKVDFEIPDYDDEFDNIQYKFDEEFIHFKFGDLEYKVALTDRMKILFSKFKERDVAELIYNYSAIMPKLSPDGTRDVSGQQWCYFDFDFIIQSYGINCEAFASPLNTFYTPINEEFRYYSLFESDHVFGSSGSFLENAPAAGRYEVNPPFIEEVLAMAAKKCVEILALPGKSFIYFVGPAWKDAEFVSILESNKFHKSTEEKLHPYLHSGKKIKTKAKSYNIILHN